MLVLQPVPLVNGDGVKQEGFGEKRLLVNNRFVVGEVDVVGPAQGPRIGQDAGTLILTSVDLAVRQRRGKFLEFVDPILKDR